MVRVVDKGDIFVVASMLRDMYMEIEPEHTIVDMTVFIDEVIRCMNDPKQEVFVDSNYRGFFIVQDETEPMTPTLIRYNGTRVFVYPSHRGSRVLKEFYDFMFKRYPKGEIFGSTAICSKHIAVLNKRHRHIANVYVLNRSK